VREHAGPLGVRVDAASDRRAEVSLEWLIRLRWGAVLGELATIAAAQLLLEARLPLARMLALVALLAVSNLGLASARGRLTRPRLACGGALVLDTLLLSGLLAASGGPSNPFSVLYLVDITLAAVVLGAGWTWLLAGLSVGCYGLLFTMRGPLPAMAHTEGQLAAHLQGMWVAFTIAAVLTAYFVVKLRTAIERRDAEITEIAELAARNERLAAVTTLAAGAAHELGTPLATIAVAARELQRSIQALPGKYARPLLEDAGLIGVELQRCRAILERLAANAGQAPGEAPALVSLGELAAEVVSDLPAAERSRLNVSAPDSRRGVTLPRGALRQVAQCLLQNALEACQGPVDLSLEAVGSRLRLEVSDRGPGMAPALLARVGEPFFSTKPPGRGLGLGLFLARSLSEQMGGRLDLESRPGSGTRAVVEVPCGA
jgi:two-component system, sensor histidine kinase RegB